MAAETKPAPIADTLAWEARQRPRAGIAAIASGFLLLAANIIGTVALKDEPVVVLSDGLRDALGSPTSGRAGLLTDRAVFIDDNLPIILGQALATAVGAALIAVVLGLLFRATQARRPEVPRFAIYLALVGPLLFALAPLIYQVSLAFRASDYVSSGDFSTLGAHDVFAGDVQVAAQLLSLPAVFATATAFVLIALNAMRAGLLTRFMGILGCIVGALTILPLGGSPIVLQSFWLVAIGLMFLGQGKVPPAWQTGVSMPWPSQQELREQAERDKKLAEREEKVTARAPSLKDELEGSMGGATATKAPAAAPKPAGSASPRSRKRKRR